MPMPMWTSDFLSSGRVAIMDAPEVGAYVLLLMRQWQAEGAGLPNDPRTLRKLARARHCDMGVVLACFEERDGRLFNQKLHAQWMKDMAFRGKQSENGSQTAAKRQPNDSQTESKTEPAGNPREDVGSRTSDSDSEGISEGEEPRTGAGRPSYPADFEEFWRACPLKVGKGDALKAWRQTASVRPPLAELVAALGRLARSRKWLDGYRVHPGRWLREHRWLDEPGPDAPSSSPVKPRLGGSNVSPETMAAYERMSGGGGES